ncbi:MAG: hypothetical protein J6Y71_00345 [Ruminococcus sp.]|nr:hypothetical protein [Ruminococcus sp.]
MKRREEMLRDLHRRIDEYEADQRAKRAKITKVAASVTPVCAAAVVGVGLWKGGTLTPHNDQLISSTLESTASDVILSADYDTSADKHSTNNKTTNNRNDESATSDAAIPRATENSESVIEGSKTDNTSVEANMPTADEKSASASDNNAITNDNSQKTTEAPAGQIEVPTHQETTEASGYSQGRMADAIAMKSVNGIVYQQFVSEEDYTCGEYIGESSTFIGFPEEGSIYFSNESHDVIIVKFTADSQVTLKKTDISPEQYESEYEQMKERMNNGIIF